MSRIQLATLLAFLAISAPASAQTISGRASVIDGDTLDIRGSRFRLHGIDAPESAQLCKEARGAEYRCGQRASLALAELIGAKNVTCEGREMDKYGRTVAVCRLGPLDSGTALIFEDFLTIAHRAITAAYDDR
jgi:endonuclease YncB( thermonuclease family)